MEDPAHPGLRPDAETVRIHYHRPPDRREVFVQEIVHRASEVVVTFLPRTPLARPMVIGGRKVLEEGSPVVWFTFPGRAHDIGRFHTADGEYTGLYANILTPVRFEREGAWHTTDLFLDVWLGAEGDLRVLDHDELAQAEAKGWLEKGVADGARAESERIVALHARGRWPPAVVAEWTLERVQTERGRASSHAHTPNEDTA